MKMGKLYLYYKNHSNSQLGDVLKVKIDDSITSEVQKNEIYELELADGSHNAKMYYEGWSEGEMVGYVDKNININGETFYIYKNPSTIYGKGELTEKHFNNSEEFKKSVNNSNIIAKVVFIVLLILAIIILLIL